MIKVLIIDDDSNFRVYLSHLIEKKFKAQINYAGDGKEGYLITLQFKPDLIIVDDDMPEMRGDQYVKKIRSEARFKDTPIVVMTASNDNNTLSNYIDFKISEYIIKPLDSERALQKLEKIINDNNKLVLVVEDNRAFRMFVEKVIKSKFNKAVVQHADNGLEALKKIEAEKPYLIILDMAMPEMNGRDLLLKLRSNEKYNDIKVVVLSGQNETKIIGEMTSLGISDYILKPVTLEELYSKLNRYFN